MLKTLWIPFAIFFGSASWAHSRAGVCESYLSFPVQISLKANARIINDNDFTVTRPLKELKTLLPDVFGAYLIDIQIGGTWVDAGAGLAQAQIDFYELHRSSIETMGSRLIAITATRPRRASDQVLRRSYRTAFQRASDRLDHMLELDRPSFRYMEGRYIEDIPTHEIANPGSVSLITDVFGPLSYSPRIDRVLRVYAEALKPGGAVFVHMNNLNRVIGPDKRVMSIPGFIKYYCRGLEVRNYPGRFWYLVRNHDEISIPALDLEHLRPGRPPTRKFRIRSTNATSNDASHLLRTNP